MLGRVTLVLITGKRDLFGLSTRKVCRAYRVTPEAVGSYPTFSPLSRFVVTVYFLWHFLLFMHIYMNTFLLGSTVLCVARTFLPVIKQSDKTACI